MKDPYGYRPYRGSRVRRKGFLINLLLGAAIAAAALWVLLLLLPLDEDGLRFPGQDDGTADSAVLSGVDNEGSEAPGAGNGDAPEGSDSSAENDGVPDSSAPNGENDGSSPGGENDGENGGSPVDAESGGASAGAAPGAENGVSPEAPDASGAQTPGEGPAFTGYAVTPLFLRKNPAKLEARYAPLPERPKNNRMVLLTAAELAQSEDRLLALFQSGAVSGAAVVVKDERGILYYPSTIPEVQGNRLVLQPVNGLTEAVTRLRAAGVQLTAVLYTHCDDRYPRRDERIALQNINGVGWRDGAMRIYLDPANPDATAYLTAIAAELEGLGFHELLLRGLGYPTDGWIARIAYPEDRFGTVNGVVSAIRETVQTARVSVWLDTSGVAANPDNGQSVPDLYGLASRVFADVPAEGGAEALRAQLAAAAGGDGKLVGCVNQTESAAALPACLLDVPLDALG